MSSVIGNFVTLRRTKGDILKPAEFRSVVEMIEGILKKYNFTEFNEAYQNFMNHLLDFNDPHHDTDTDFFDEIVELTYSVYVKMTPTPLSLVDFRVEIVPTIAFLELIRRIVLNSYLYDRVRNTDGSVPQFATLLLSPDWGRTVSPNTPVEINFGNGIINEDEFLKRGWTVNTTPLPVIFNAVDLTTLPFDRQVIWSTSSVSPYVNFLTRSTSNYDVPLKLSSSDLTIEVDTTGTPAERTHVFSISNTETVFSVYVETNNTVSVLRDGVVFVNPTAYIDSYFEIDITRQGDVYLTGLNHGTELTRFNVVPSEVIGNLDTLSIRAPLESNFNREFGIKSLSLFRYI